MAHKIVISGNYIDPKDFDLIDSKDQLTISVFPKLSEMSKDTIKHFRDESFDSDLVIIALFGSDIRLVQNLGLESLPAVKALWSFDSHHQWPLERGYQHLFDKIFICHSPYMKYFESSKVEWCPGCFIRYGVEGLKQLLDRENGIDAVRYDVVFPFKPHLIGSRNTFASGLKRRLRDLNIAFYMGPVDSGEPYMKLLQSSKIVANISLTDDLNIRNFETWALNRVLLANQTPDHTRLDAIPTTTVYFKRDLSDLSQRLKEAMDTSKDGSSSSGWVLNGHMQIHRYVQIINTALDTDFHVRKI